MVNQLQQRWTCEGNVRGRCDKIHRTFTTAERHCARDMADCRKQGGYSDRSPKPLNDAAKAAQRASEPMIRYHVQFASDTDSLHIHAVGAPDVDVISTVPRFNGDGHTLAIYDVPADRDFTFSAELDADETVVSYRQSEN